MADRPVGLLTIFSADRSEIYGELSDATWREEDVNGQKNYVYSGVAGEGTWDTFMRLNAEGIDHVAYDFEANGSRHSGTATMLRPDRAAAPGAAIIQIETGQPPQPA